MPPPEQNVEVLTDKPSRHDLVDGGKWKASSKTLHLPGYARTKRWSTRNKYSAKQLVFLRWGFSIGQKDPNQKLSAERAEELMKLVGTIEGEKRYPKDPYMKANSDGKPAFTRLECIEKYEIKSFFRMRHLPLKKEKHNYKELCLSLFSKSFEFCWKKT